MIEEPESPEGQPPPARAEGVAAEGAATEPETPAPAASPTGPEQPYVSEAQVEELPGPPPPAPESSYLADGGTASDEHPEIAVGAAFAGGFLLAMFLKRLVR